MSAPGLLKPDGRARVSATFVGDFLPPYMQILHGIICVPFMASSFEDNIPSSQYPSVTCWLVFRVWVIVHDAGCDVFFYFFCTNARVPTEDVLHNRRRTHELLLAGVQALQGHLGAGIVIASFWYIFINASISEIGPEDESQYTCMSRQRFTTLTAFLSLSMITLNCLPSLSNAPRRKEST